MKKHADYALTGVFASLMLLASVQLGFNNNAHAGEDKLSVTAAGKTVVLIGVSCYQIVKLGASSSTSPVAILATMTAAPTASAGLFWPLGPLGTADNLLFITAYGTSAGHSPITVSGP